MTRESCLAWMNWRSRPRRISVATVLWLSYQTSLGTAPKNSKAATIPSRIASVSKGMPAQRGRSSMIPLSGAIMQGSVSVSR